VSNKVNQNAKIVRVSEAIAPDLMLRVVAEAFFDEIERSEEKTLALDFTGVRFVSRSFAHQYAIRKKGSKKRITEVNVSKEVERMLDLASHVHTAPKVTLPRVGKSQLITV
jgi:STAS-like domain of unknown function (DUF4325)